MRKSFMTCGIILGGIVVFAVIGAMLAGTFLSRPLPTVVIPPPPAVPADNGFDICVKAASMVKDADRLDGLDAAKQPREAESLVKLNRPALDLVRKALPKGYLTPGMKTWDEEFPYLSGFRRIGSLFVLEGQLKATRGDLHGSAESFLDARRFGALIPNGGTAIHRFVGIAVSEQGYAGLESICTRLGASECTYVLEEMERADLREPSFRQTLDWESRLGLGFIRDLQEGKIKDSSGKPMGRPIPPMIDRILGRGQSSLEEYQSHMRAMGVESDKPFHLRKPVPEPKSLGSIIAVPAFDLLTRTSLSSTKEQILKIMIALRHYRLEHDEHPESLAALESYGIETMDEFSGKKLIYKRTGDRYLLYSVGPDGRDDGGAPLVKNGESYSGDVAAGKLFPPGK